MKTEDLALHLQGCCLAPYAGMLLFNTTALIFTPDSGPGVLLNLVIRLSPGPHSCPSVLLRPALTLDALLVEGTMDAMCSSQPADLQSGHPGISNLQLTGQDPYL